MIIKPMKKSLQENDVLLSNDEMPKNTVVGRPVDWATTTDSSYTGQLNNYDSYRFYEGAQYHTDNERNARQRERAISMTIQWAKVMSSTGKEITDTEFNEKLISFNNFIQNGII